MSTAVTTAPRRAAASAVLPFPAATSSTRSPGPTAAISTSASDAGAKMLDQNE
jgi:hypothetical protein